MNSDLAATMINGSLYAFAKTCNLGFTTISTNLNTSDTPYNYTTGYILRRSNSDVVITLYSVNNDTPTTYTNSTVDGGNTWSGWASSVKNTDIGQFKYVAGSIPASGTLQIVHNGVPFAYMVFVQGNMGWAYASYIVQGYGTGTTDRDHFFTLQNGNEITAKIVNNSFVVTNTSTSIVEVRVIVFMGELPTLK